MERRAGLELSVAGVGGEHVLGGLADEWAATPAVRFHGPLAPNLVDLGCLLGVFGIYLAAVLRGMVDYSLVAVGDPRIGRALDFENA